MSLPNPRRGHLPPETRLKKDGLSALRERHAGTREVSRTMITIPALDLSDIFACAHRFRSAALPAQKCGRGSPACRPAGAAATPTINSASALIRMKDDGLIGAISVKGVRRSGSGRKRERTRLQQASSLNHAAQSRRRTGSRDTPATPRAVGPAPPSRSFCAKRAIRCGERRI